MARLRKSKITDEKIDQWIKSNLNVLFTGRHGTGKTTIVTESWKRFNLNYLYFSGSTLDPWVDFIGIPDKVKDEDGNNYIELIRPKSIALDQVEAIFIDEYNRSHKKIRNAVMELMQFKSINGKKLNNLRFIWAAVNPDEDAVNKYDVDKIDPAQKDRFQIHVEIPYEPNRIFFTKKYGSDIATAAISWWNSQAPEIKDQISPRRLEYTLDHFFRNGDLEDIIPDGANVAHLVGNLKNTPRAQSLRNLIAAKDEKGMIDFLKDEENYNHTIQVILGNRSMVEFCVPLMPEEKTSQLINDNLLVQSWAISNGYQNARIKEVLSNIVKANVNKELVRKVNKALISDNAFIVNNSIEKCIINNKAVIYNNGQNTSKDLQATIQVILNGSLEATHERKNNYDLLLKNIPKNIGTNEEALGILKIVGKIIESSHFGTLAKHFTNIMEVINAAVKHLHNNNGVIPDFSKEYPKLNEYIVLNKEKFIFLAEEKSPEEIKTVIQSIEPLAEISF